MLLLIVVPKYPKRDASLWQEMRMARFIHRGVRPLSHLTHEFIGANMTVVGLEHLHKQTSQSRGNGTQPVLP
jgi:hypothetical protein